MVILKTAALFHDCGFVNVYHEHEEEGCRIALERLPAFDYTAEQVEKICELIMATKMPQQPKTTLEKILCDADLSYLGRDDYESTAQKLFEEWNQRGKISSVNEWNKVQIKFLESHHYWTSAGIAKGENKKKEHLKKLREMS